MLVIPDGSVASQTKHKPTLLCHLVHCSNAFFVCKATSLLTTSKVPVPYFTMNFPAAFRILLLHKKWVFQKIQRKITCSVPRKRRGRSKRKKHTVNVIPMTRVSRFRF